jgi:hypothetical protein
MKGPGEAYEKNINRYAFERLNGNNELVFKRLMKIKTNEED